MKVSVVGLGHMGSGIAASVLRAGHETTVYNRTRKKAEPLEEQGATVASSVKEACQAEALITMLSDDRAVESVVFGDEGVLACLPRGSVHISSSTISVALAKRLAAAHASAGQGFVAAPVIGRPDLAAAGQLFVIAAGDGGPIGIVGPVLDAVGQRTFVVSERAEDANLVKLTCNFLIASVIEAVGEALAPIEKSGLDPTQYVELLTSTIFGAPVYQTYGGLIASRRFEPAQFAARLAEKDMHLLFEAATELRVPMPLASVVHGRLLRLMASGGGDRLDWSAMGELTAIDAGLVHP